MNEPETNKTETPSAVRSHDLLACDVCHERQSPQNLKHLSIYVAGSEGVNICITCRHTLTEVLRGMMRVGGIGRKQGFKVARQMRAVERAG